MYTGYTKGNPSACPPVYFAMIVSQHYCLIRFIRILYGFCPQEDGPSCAKMLDGIPCIPTYIIWRKYSWLWSRLSECRAIRPLSTQISSIKMNLTATHLGWIGLTGIWSSGIWSSRGYQQVCLFPANSYITGLERISRNLTSGWVKVKRKMAKFNTG